MGDESIARGVGVSEDATGGGGLGCSFVNEEGRSSAQRSGGSAFVFFSDGEKLSRRCQRVLRCDEWMGVLVVRLGQIYFSVQRNSLRICRFTLTEPCLLSLGDKVPA